MATKNNSMQLRRFSNTMDLHNNRSASFFESGAEMVKLPALRAINKSVKYNDLSYATTRDMQKLHKQPEESLNMQQMSAHHSLLSIRKKYDNMNKMREEFQRQVDNLQKQLDKLQNEKNRFESEKNSGSSTIGDSSNGLQAAKAKLQEAEVQKKVILNLISRYKADKIVYDLRKYSMQKDLSQLSKKIAIIHKQYLKQKSQNQNSQKFKNKYLSHLEAEQQERNCHMNIVEGRLQEKSVLIQNNEKRAEQIQEISQLTLQDKDYKEKNWYKVYLCHRFVQKLLRDKMNRQMLKFNTVQFAFKNIKTETGVNTSDMLIKKYLNKEAAYGQLLGKIAQNQKSINDLNSETQELKKERRQLQTEQQILSANKKQKKDLSKEQRQFQQMGQKTKVCESYHQRLKSWLQRTLQKFKIWQTQEQNLQQKNIIGSFKHFHKKILNSLQHITDSDDKQKKLQQVHHENNYRIVFAENPQNQKKKNKTNNQNQQQDYVNNQRQQMIRNNDKYMKQLRKKFEDLKKTQIQAEPKKREIILEKPKIPIVQS